jgi:hypothetical protein
MPTVNTGIFFYIHPMLEMFSGPWKEILSHCRMPEKSGSWSDNKANNRRKTCNIMGASNSMHMYKSMDLTAWTSATAGSPSKVTGNSREDTLGDVENVVLTSHLQGRSVTMLEKQVSFLRRS